MSKSKKNTIEGLFYNNKFLMVFSVVVAILIWTTIKINYSVDDSKTIKDVKVDIAKTGVLDKDLDVFYGNEYEGEDNFVTVSVEITGKSYNINAVESDDIIIKATNADINEPKQKTLTLTAEWSESSGITGVTIKKVIPSTLQVYVDTNIPKQLNVEARLDENLKLTTPDGFTIGLPAPSLKTVEVTGPATILDKLSKVYFDAIIDENGLHLTESKEVSANIVYPNISEQEMKYLYCKEAATATVSIPVSAKKKLNTTVNFIKQPNIYMEVAPEYKIDPAVVEVIYSSAGEEKETLLVGEVDFSTVLNEVKTVKCPVSDKIRAELADKTIEEFVVTLDMSHNDKLTFSSRPSIINCNSGDVNYNYIVNYEKSGLDSITVIGPKEKLEKMTEDDIQVNIDVSTLDVTNTGEQLSENTNISFFSEGYEDCWFYGKYTAYITVEPKS